MLYTIYKTTNKINGKIYIGQHVTLDLADDYLGSGTMLKLAITKYGKENFVKDILFVFKTEKEMNEKEAEIVNEEFYKREDTYNLTEGGKGNRRAIIEYAKSEKGRIESAGKMKQLHKTPGFQERRINGMIRKHGQAGFSSFEGKKHTQETLDKMSQSSKGQGEGSANSQFGTCWITNGITNKKISLTELEIYTEIGYRKGRVINKN